MTELKKVLSYRVLLLIVINSIMGTGIFFLPALGARYAGPASIISWSIMALFAIYISMCFGELASMYPKAGGIYEFSKHAYGRFASFIIGWMTLITGNITIAMLAVGAIRYLLPAHLHMPLIIASILIILSFNLVAYRGMKVSATMLVTFSFITLGTILLLIIMNIPKVQASGFQPFLPFGIPAIYLAIFFIAETFFGWESATFLAGETKNGKVVVPKALVRGTIIIALITLALVFTTIGVLGWKALGDTSVPLSQLAAVHFGAAGVSIFAIIIYLAIIGSVADWVVSAPRLILSMAHDRLYKCSV